MRCLVKQNYLNYAIKGKDLRYFSCNNVMKDNWQVFNHNSLLLFLTQYSTDKHLKKFPTCDQLMQKLFRTVSS